MAFCAPISEQKFVLNQVAGIGELAGHQQFAHVDDDLVGAILEGVGRFAANEWAPLNRVGDEVGPRLTPDGVRMPDGFALAYRRYVEAGWGTIAVPACFGGQGLPFLLQTAVLETLGTANLGLTLAPMLTLGAIEALIHHGSPKQQHVFLPNLCTGVWSGTMNLTEPQAGSDVGALRTVATPVGDGKWKIHGTKIFISYGDHDMSENIIHLVLARTPSAPEGTRGISLFAVPKYRLDAEGRLSPLNDIKVVSIEHKLGLRASPTCVLSFGEENDCIGELVGSEHAGLRAMFAMMNNARLNVGLQGVQVAEAASQRAVAYALERVQSARAGRADRKPVRIADHPDVRRMLLRMRAQTQAARALVYFTASQVDKAATGDVAAKGRLDLLTPLAKAHATDVANEVTSLGIQVHGGTGYIEETGAAQHFRDARILAIYEGTNGIQAADLVQRRLTMKGGSPFVALIEEMRSEAMDEKLISLIETCREVGARLSGASADDRLSGSYPFLTMLAVAVCGWLFERSDNAAGNDKFGIAKKAAARFYLDRILPEALGLRCGAIAGADPLYSIDVEALRG